MIVGTVVGLDSSGFAALHPQAKLAPVDRMNPKTNHVISRSVA